MANHKVIPADPGQSEIRFRLTPSLHSEISHISKHLGISMTDFIRIEMRKAVDHYPQYMREAFKELARK